MQPIPIVNKATTIVLSQPAYDAPIMKQPGPSAAKFSQKRNYQK